MIEDLNEEVQVLTKRLNSITQELDEKFNAMSCIMEDQIAVN